MQENIKESKQGNEPAQDMKHHILQVASSLMTSKGIKETSLKDIAQTAGISQGTLYYHYSAKEDIIYDIAEENLIAATSDLFDALKISPENVNPKKLLKVLSERVLAQESRARLHLYLLSNVSTNEKLKQKYYSRYDAWISMLQMSIDKVYGKNENNRHLATVVLAVLDGLLIQQACGHREFPLDKLVDILIH